MKAAARNLEIGTWYSVEFVCETWIDAELIEVTERHDGLVYTFQTEDEAIYRVYPTTDCEIEKLP